MSEDRRYMGIDIAEGSPLSQSRARYSVVIIGGDGRLISVDPAIPLSRVIRLAWDYRPARIGLDNPFELARNSKELEKILGLFPPDSEIIQITLTPEGQLQKLKSVARDHGLEVDRGKPSSVRTAFLLAYLAKEGEGAPVRVVEEKTVILVSKARTPRGGGFSQQRLQRRVRASVHLAAMRVKEALEKAGVEYDMSYRRSLGGLESAVFTVYVPRSRLYGIVRPHRGLDYTVTVKAVYKTRLNVAGEGEQSSRLVIVGVDPGVTTGLAVLDLNGRLVHLASSKGLDRGSIIEEISRLGRPVVFAVDVSEVPESVRWLAAKFGATIYSPPEDLEAAEKREIAARILGRPPVDAHQRDALAAAYKAFQAIRRKLEHAEHELSKIGVEIDLEKVKESIMRGVTLAEAIEKAIEDILGSELDSDRAVSEEGATEPRGRGEARGEERGGENLVLLDKLERLEAERITLTGRIRELEKKLRAAELEAERLKRGVRLEVLRDEEVKRLGERVRLLEGRVAELESRLEESRSRIGELKSLLAKVQRGEVVLLRMLPSLTPRVVRRSEEQSGALLPGEVLYLPNPSVVEYEAVRILRESSVKGVITGDEETARRLASLGVPAVPVSRVPGGVSSLEEVYYASASLVELLEESAREIMEAKARELDLERLVEEYRSSRAKIVRRGDSKA